MDLFSPTNGLWRSQEKGCRPSKNLSGYLSPARLLAFCFASAPFLPSNPGSLAMLAAMRRGAGDPKPKRPLGRSTREAEQLIKRNPKQCMRLGFLICAST
jgi:hypothetical protein